MMLVYIFISSNSSESAYIDIERMENWCADPDFSEYSFGSLFALSSISIMYFLLTSISYFL